MDAIGKMRWIPDYTPNEIVEYIYAHAVTWQNNRVSWLEVVDGEVVQRIWFYRNYKKRGREVTKYVECVRKTTGDKHIIWRNGYWGGGFGNGFYPVYEQKEVVHWYYGYENACFSEREWNVWKEEREDLFDRCTPVLNLDVLSETRFKYCAYPCNCDLIRWLRVYDADNSIEFFGKCGLYPFPSFVNLAKKDRRFCRFLRDNAADVDLYGPQAAIYAYKNGVDVVEARRICERKARIDRDVRDYIPNARGTCIDRNRLYEYLEKTKAKDGKNAGLYSLLSSYNDYLRAIKGLGLDLRDTKNVYPADFWRMHDLRVDEYKALEAKQDREKRKKLYDDFAEKALELKPLEWAAEGFVIIIPNDISDLIREGGVLNHCVGKMGYELKVIKGQSIIAFVRKAEAPDAPLVTLEYRIDLGKLAQCYGRSDTVPSEDIRALAETWAKRVKKQLKESNNDGKRIGNKKSTAVRAGA